MFEKKEFEVEIKKSGKTRKEIADYLGISLVTLQKKINGHVDWKGKEIYNVCKFLGITDKDHIFFN